MAYSKCCGSGNQLVSCRVGEKSDLQDLNQRFAEYINKVRSWRFLQEHSQKKFEEEHWAEKISGVRSMYEAQISDLRCHLETAVQEKNELEASRAKFDSMSSEFESRLISLNESVLNQKDEILKLQAALSQKELELQQSQAQLTGPRTELESCRLERDELRQKLEEAERRCANEEKGKIGFQSQVTELHERFTREVAMYQNEINILNGRLESSRQLMLELEETARRSGQQSGDLAEMMKNAREASEAEFRRYMEEAEAKHSLNISELKMRLEADTRSLTDSIEENGKLRIEMNNLLGRIEEAQSKLTSAESAYKVVQNSLESERKVFDMQLHKMESKLQETQDLLMIKIQELTAAQEANVPLRAEIDALKALIDEEEKRFELASRLNHGRTTFESKQFEVHRTQPTVFAGQNTTSQAASFLSQNCKSATAQAFAHTKHTNPAFLATNGFTRSTEGADPYGLSCGRMRDYKLDTAVTLSHDNNAGQVDNSNFPVRKSLPPEKLPKRPLIAANARYIPADAGQGKDYFNSMFNDLRKDTLYTKVTESGVGVDSAKVKSSTHQDLVNSTASATGNLKIMEVDESGRFVRVHNTSATKTEEVGGCQLQQNVAGHPVAVFRFPPRVKLQPGQTATVWSYGADGSMHDPPAHYLWKQLDRWGTGPECTTILTRPNGQAIAWMTSAPRISRVSKAYQHQPDVVSQTEETQQLLEKLKMREAEQTEEGDKYFDYSGDSADGNFGRVPLPIPASYGTAPTKYADAPSVPTAAPVLRRDRSGCQPYPSKLLPKRTDRSPQKYTASPSAIRHDSQVSAADVSTVLPDNSASSACNEQALNQCATSSLGRYFDSNFTRKDHAVSEKEQGLIGERHLTRSAGATLQSSPGSSRLLLPGTFYSPSEQHRRGVEWVRSNHNLNFLPPMPRTFPNVIPLYKKSPNPVPPAK